MVLFMYVLRFAEQLSNHISYIVVIGSDSIGCSKLKDVPYIPPFTHCPVHVASQ